MSTTRRSFPSPPRRTGPATRRSAGAPAAATTRSSTAVQMLMPDLGVRREDTVFVSGIGCAARFPYYMNTYGHALDPRAGAGHRHRPGRGPPRPARVGRHRRRRRPVDRRQPPHPRPAPQRQPHDPAVQQPDLRAHQGPVLADQRARARSPSPRRSARSTSPFNPLSRGPRRRGQLRGPHPRHGPQAHDGDVPAGPRPQGRGVRRGLPELQRLQRRRLRGRSRPRTVRDRHAHPAAPRRADPLRRRGRARASSSTRSRAARIVEVADVGEDALLVHDEARPRPERGLPAVPPVAEGRTSRRRSACSGPSSGRLRLGHGCASWPPPWPTRGRATSPPSSAPAPPGRSS